MDKRIIDRAEMLRYMGHFGDVDLTLEKLIDDAACAVCDAAKPHFTYVYGTARQYEYLLTGDDIKRHIEGCENIIIFAATLGVGVDNLIRKLSAENMPLAFAADAAASAAIEGFCREADKKISHDFGSKYITPRFSPGYGDYPIEIQSKIISVLDAERRIGLCVTDSFVLVPRKSVTAVCGVSDKPVLKEKYNGCESCNLKNNCPYEKKGACREFS